MDLRWTSPDGRSVLELFYENEIRFGPAYYRCSINGRFLRDRVFGDACLWSPDSEYVVLQEWRSTREQDGPQTSLFICRISDLRFYAKARASGGFVEPTSFEGSVLVFRRHYYGTGVVADAEINLNDISSWEALAIDEEVGYQA